MFRRVLKKISSLTWQPLVRRKISRTQIFHYKNFKLVIPPGVFHPGYFFSTKIFARFLETQDLSGKHILELGCGSGLLSMIAGSKNARVTASDINAVAISNLEENARNNQLNVRCIHSDLFENTGSDKFDRILINPPFFPKDPASEAEFAWYCGANYEYFTRLFQTIGQHLEQEGKIWMILSEDCDHGKILGLASANGFHYRAILQKRNAWEANTIYEITAG